MKTYEDTLPAEYKELKIIDATDKKLGILFNVLAIVIMVMIFAIGTIIYHPSIRREDINPIHIFLFAIAFLLYVVAHELVHGIAYKVLTKRKLTFGITLSVAFCGVPDIYVYRRTALIALLSPFIFFSLILSICLFSFKGIEYYFALTFFAMHVGGCVGDLYDSYLFLFKYRDKEILMNDTGPKQTIYGLKEE